MRVGYGWNDFVPGESRRRLCKWSGVAGGWRAGGDCGEQLLNSSDFERVFEDYFSVRRSNYVCDSDIIYPRPSWFNEVSVVVKRCMFFNCRCNF